MPISPNMGLNIPVVSTTTGPQYAQDVNSSLSKLDAHNHTSGQGVQVPSAGININANLPMNNHGLLNASIINLASQALPPASGTVYRNNDDLYYVDGTGANVRITQGGAVAVSGAVGFSGLPFGTASASYNNLTQTFIFQSATNTSANVDCGSVILREVVSSANGVTLASPLALAGNYTMYMPPSLPAVNSYLQLSPAGAVTNVAITSVESPVGSIIMFGGSVAPAGWLLCDGQVLDSVANPIYASLFAVIGTTYGGTGASNFAVPNISGIFVRGVGSQSISGQTYSGTLGTKQVDNLESHNHGGATGSSTVPVTTVNIFNNGSATGIPTNTQAAGSGTISGSGHTHTISASGSGTETYPANITLTYIIKI